MSNAARRAATTMTTHSTADRTLLRFGSSLSGTGSAGGRSAGGAVVGSIGEPRVQPGCLEPSASLRAVALQEPAGGLATNVGESGIAGLGDTAVGAEPEEQSLQPRLLTHGERHAHTPASQLLDGLDRVLLGHPPGGRRQLDGDAGIVVARVVHGAGDAALRVFHRTVEHGCCAHAVGAEEPVVADGMAVAREVPLASGREHGVGIDDPTGYF